MAAILIFMINKTNTMLLKEGINSVLILVAIPKAHIKSFKGDLQE